LSGRRHSQAVAMDEPHVPLSGILQQRLDPLTGQSEWVVVASGNRPLCLSVSLSLCSVQKFDLSLAFELLSAFSENFHEYPCFSPGVIISSALHCFQ